MQRQYAIKVGRAKYLKKSPIAGEPALLLTKDINEAALWSLEEPLNLEVCRSLMKYGRNYTNGQGCSLIRVKISEDI